MTLYAIIDDPTSHTTHVHAAHDVAVTDRYVSWMEYVHGPDHLPSRVNRPRRHLAALVPADLVGAALDALHTPVRVTQPCDFCGESFLSVLAVDLACIGQGSGIACPACVDDEVTS